MSYAVSHEIRACGKLALFLWKTLCKIGVDIVVFIVYNRGINIKRKVKMNPSDYETKRKSLNKSVDDFNKELHKINKDFGIFNAPDFPKLGKD